MNHILKFRQILIPALLTVMLLLPKLSRATLVFPVNGHSLFTNTTGSQLYTVNSDMLLGSGGEISVVAWDEYGPLPAIAGAHFTVRDWTGASLSYVIPNTSAEATPDVVLASTPTGEYYVMITYVDIVGMCWLWQYEITGVGSSVLSFGALYREMIPAPTACWYPHIDMYPDYNNPDLNGYPSMHQFVLSVSGSISPFYSGDVYALWGDILIPPTPPSQISVSPLLQVTNSGNYMMGGDIAAAIDANGNYLAYLATQNGVFVEQYDLAIPLPLNIANPLNVVGPVNNITAAATSIPQVRIEAMAYNSGSQVAWMIGTCLWNGSDHEVWQFNPRNLPVGENMSALDCSSLDNLSVNVCAGVGQLNGNICNENYNIGWNGRNFVTRVVDAFTGASSGIYPDTYVAESPSVTYLLTHKKVPICVTSSSNSGKFMLTSFWDPTNNAIQYQLKPGIAGYKPAGSTNIETLKTGKYAVYPNPASTSIFVEHTSTATYTINNLTGRLIQQGSLRVGKTEINIDDLAVGVYVLNLTEKGKTESLKIIKTISNIQ